MMMMIITLDPHCLFEDPDDFVCMVLESHN